VLQFDASITLYVLHKLGLVNAVDPGKLWLVIQPVYRLAIATVLRHPFRPLQETNCVMHAFSRDFLLKGLQMQWLAYITTIIKQQSASNS